MLRFFQKNKKIELCVYCKYFYYLCEIKSILKKWKYLKE